MEFFFYFWLLKLKIKAKKHIKKKKAWWFTHAEEDCGVLAQTVLQRKRRGKMERGR